MHNVVKSLDWEQQTCRTINNSSLGHIHHIFRSVDYVFNTSRGGYFQPVIPAENEAAELVLCVLCADCALSLSALWDLCSGGVSVDRPDDREAGVRTPGQPLRLHQEGRQLLLLVPRCLLTQEGVPGRRGALKNHVAHLMKNTKNLLKFVKTTSGKSVLFFILIKKKREC